MSSFRSSGRLPCSGPRSVADSRRSTSPISTSFDTGATSSKLDRDTRSTEWAFLEMDATAERSEHVGDGPHRHIPAPIEKLGNVAFRPTQALSQVRPRHSLLFHELTDQLSDFENGSFLLVEPHSFLRLGHRFSERFRGHVRLLRF